ncbi:hypothetical protein K439DRAFT_1387682 [Ramaria rubella]|nr:hypothetical protein K439DRAFT_1387682 [Ramaria rubella]
MNAAANHNFISHDGITTFTEMVAASQNIYNMGWDLAVLLAALAVAEDGDIITEKCSIGREATSETGFLGGILSGKEGGYNDHNKFEADTSLTRNDFFLDPHRDNFSFNGTLFGYMQASAAATSKGLFDRETMMAYQALRYRQSLADNGNFFYGPKAIILLGAATFVYHLFPSDGIVGIPNLPVTASFFGAVHDPSALGGYRHEPERIPPFWGNTPTPYGLLELLEEVTLFLITNPKENIFGGNVGRGNFIPLDFGPIKNGRLGSGDVPTVNDVACLIYQLLTDNTPSGLDGVINKSLEVIMWVAKKINPIFEQFGCPLVPLEDY